MYHREMKTAELLKHIIGSQTESLEVLEKAARASHVGRGSRGGSRPDPPPDCRWFSREVARSGESRRAVDSSFGCELLCEKC